MKPEMVPYKTLEREGYLLVAFRQVALPIFWSRVRFLSAERKGVRPIPEFVLKCIGAGLSNVEAIAGVLGITERLVVGALHELLNLDAVYVGTLSGKEQHGLVLSQRGQELLTHLKITVIQEQEVQLPIDGMTRRYCNIERKQLRSGIDVETFGHLELPATPNRKPSLDDVEIELRRFYIDAAQKDRTVVHDISEMLSIDRTDRLFRDDAYILYYRSSDGTIDYGIYVGEQASSEHEEAARSWDVVSAKPILPSTIDQAAPNLETTLSLLCGGPKSARSGLALVNPFRLTRLMRDALNKASSRILIATIGISNGVVSDEFTLALESALKRGVNVYIAYDDAAIKKRDSCEQALRNLESLKAKYKNVFIMPRNASGANVLVYDERYAVVSRMDLLGYLGQGDVPCADELGYYWDKQPGINRLFDNVVSLSKT